MPDIILKGRDTSGNLVDNVYRGVDIISVKNPDEEDTKFYARPFNYINMYFVRTVLNEDKTTRSFEVLAGFSQVIKGPFGAYGNITGDEFDEYKYLDTNADFNYGGSVLLCFTMKQLEIGGLYDPGDLILEGGD